MLSSLSLISWSLLPGASPLEPKVTPTSQASLHIVCDVPSVAVCCSESTECFPCNFQIFLWSSYYYSSSPSYYWNDLWLYISFHICCMSIQVCPSICWFIICGFSYPQFTMAPQKLEQAITWWNQAAQMHPVIHSSSFVPVLKLPRRTYLHSASTILAVRISCRDMALFVFRKPLFINKLHGIYVCYTNITLYIAFGIICSFM
jgi:hypothetical protein